MEAVYTVKSNQEACEHKGTKPIFQVLEMITEESSNLILDCSESPMVTIN